jgi:hypothetical protein
VQLVFKTFLLGYRYLRSSSGYSCGTSRKLSAARLLQSDFRVSEACGVMWHGCPEHAFSGSGNPVAGYRHIWLWHLAAPLRVHHAHCSSAGVPLLVHVVVLQLLLLIIR